MTRYLPVTFAIVMTQHGQMIGQSKTDRGLRAPVELDMFQAAGLQPFEPMCRIFFTPVRTLTDAIPVREQQPRRVTLVDLDFRYSPPRFLDGGVIAGRLVYILQGVCRNEVPGLSGIGGAIDRYRR